MRNIPNRLIKIFRNRPATHPICVAVIGVVLLFLLYNNTFWGIWADAFQGSYAQGLVFIAAFFALWCALLAPFSFSNLIRYVVASLLVLSAVTSFYLDRLGVVIDRDMIQNVVSTTITEGKHLVTPSLVLWIILWGILPAGLALCIRVRKIRPFRALLENTLFFVIFICGFVGLLAVDFKGNAAVLRSRGDLKASFQPLAPMVGAFRYVAMIARSNSMEFQQIGLDAKLGDSARSARNPLLTVIVVGETARSKNFSLGEYERQTNPELEQRDIVYYDNVASCGTATAISLPCMFSKFDRANYSYELGRAHENILDVVDRAGYHIEWIDNNTGDKGLADRQNFTMVTHSDNPKYCSEGECIDGILVSEVRKRLPNITENTILVLHQIGSHGPSYYLRYPRAFEAFQPACRTADFSACTAQEITNAYDNTIAYTDKVLADLVDVLDAETDLTTSMIYISDHGESLGEKGLYLHGTPYFMAPEEQTKVPMIIWLSREYKAAFSVEHDCLKSGSQQALTHANLFHSLLGLLDVRTEEHIAEMDVFDNCKRKDQ